MAITRTSNGTRGESLSTNLDRRPIIAWVMFPKFLDDIERIRDSRANLAGKRYRNGFLAEANRLRALQEKTAAELDALLPSILDRAFKGEL